MAAALTFQRGPFEFFWKWTDAVSGGNAYVITVPFRRYGTLRSVEHWSDPMQNSGRFFSVSPLPRGRNANQWNCVRVCVQLEHRMNATLNGTQREHEVK